MPTLAPELTDPQSATLSTYDAFNDDAPSLLAADRPAAPPSRRFLVPSPATFRHYTCCPWATSRIVRDVETGAPCLTPVTCKRWGCAFCAPRRIRRLAYLTRGAEPNRWIRLGVQPSLYESPKAAWRATSPKVPELCRRLKKQYGECEYLRVCELHNGTTKYTELDQPAAALGYPHYHALLRSSFIPQKTLSQIWGALTGAPVVWISKIDQSFSSFRYLTKYLTKLHRLEWTDRHVSYSRHFFNPADLEKISFPQRDLIEISPLHPWVLLTNRYSEQSVAANPDGTYLLPDTPDEYQCQTTPETFGLRTVLPPTPAQPPLQKHLDGWKESHADPGYQTPF